LKPSMCMAVAAPDYGIARQQWRARIETTPSVKHIAHLRASPASNGGRGLKQVEIWMGDPPHPGIARQQWRARIETSPNQIQDAQPVGIARQQWRARIETIAITSAADRARCIARQQWRARIET